MLKNLYDLQTVQKILLKLIESFSCLQVQCLQNMFMQYNVIISRFSR